MRYLAFLSLLAVVGCSNEEAAPKERQGPPSAVAEARQIFDQRCSVCHGVSGHGDGPAAGSLNPRPRNYSDKAWQASVTDADLRSIIVKGGPANGKSAMMPPNPDLASKPEVVDALVQRIRSFGK